METLKNTMKGSIILLINQVCVEEIKRLYTSSANQLERTSVKKRIGKWMLHEAIEWLLRTMEEVVAFGKFLS